jgi:phosphoribosylanthranilate isomerase
VFDWHVLENLDLKLPFMVSGGLNAGNVAQALHATGVGGVDVSSGVERAVGVKDGELIRGFIRAARASAPASPLRQEPRTPLSPQGRGEGAETARRRGKN